MNRILLTGAASFTARYLLPLLTPHRDPAEIFCSDLSQQGPPGFPYRAADVTSPDQVLAMVRAADPQLVFHLAGVVSQDEDLCYSVNLEGTRNLLKALATLKPPRQVVFISSAAVYGLTRAEESPVAESVPLRPVSPYGASKAAAEMAVLSHHRRGAVSGIVVRPFNLVGPGLPRGFAPADFAQQVRDIRDGRATEELRVGNLTPRRDFVDVRDAVRAYESLSRTENVFGQVFNVGTGRPVAVRQILNDLLRIAGVAATVTTDPAKVRPVEVEEQVADVTAVAEAVSWRAETPLEDSLLGMLQTGGSSS